MARLVVFVAAVMLLLPAAAFAQGRGHGRNKADIFVNGHDARDGRYDGRGPRRDDVYYQRGRRSRDYDDDYYDRYGRRRDRGRYDDRYGDRYGYQIRQVAMNNGYREGLDEGRKDGRNGDRYNYTDEGDYRSGTKGYNSRYGDRELYRRYFREGFAQGYREGYQQYGGYYGRGRDRDYDYERDRRSRARDVLEGIFGRRP